MASFVFPLPQVPDVDASVDVPNVSGDEVSASVAVPGEPAVRVWLRFEK